MRFFPEFANLSPSQRYTRGVPAPIYSIGAVARMISVPPATLRTWEERYGLVLPERGTGGHRLYTRDQVEQLRFVKSQIDAGVPAADAHRLLGQRLDNGSQFVRHEWSAAGPRLLVLLAERDPYAAELEEYFLRTEGYDIELAFDADEALEKAAATTPQLVVVELLISGGQGVELCRRLKERTSAPVLAVSSLDGRDAAIAAGADCFLQKPLDPLQLVSAAKDLLGLSAYLGPSS
jgi:DNA-binding transcriptional MerR regulator